MTSPGAQSPGHAGQSRCVTLTVPQTHPRAACPPASPAPPPGIGGVQAPPIPGPQPSPSPSCMYGVLKTFPPLSGFSGGPAGAGESCQVAVGEGTRGLLGAGFVALCVEKSRIQIWRRLVANEAVVNCTCLSAAHDKVPVHPVHAREEDLQGEGGRGQDVCELGAQAAPPEARDGSAPP